MASDHSVSNRTESNFTVENTELPDRETNGLHLELAPFGLEHVYDYESDGHHPIHLGDTYGRNGRYRVIHKLGSGGFATVWLCRDSEAKEATKYVALKVLMAEVSSDDCPELRVNQIRQSLEQNADECSGAGFICLPLDHFKIHGPNGDHFCFVYPVLGPNVSLGFFHASGDADKDLRALGLQVTKAIAFLHRKGICHGDLTPNNVLHRISGLDGLDEDQVLTILGRPVVNPVLNASHEQYHGDSAPDYLVYPVNWSEVDTHFISIESCLIDFGESFEVSQPPDRLGIPGPYRSPELILDRKASLASDIWALGCTIFEIRTGRKLFCPFDDDDDEYLYAFVQLLGRLPEPWWSESWKNRRIMYDDKVNENGMAIPVAVSIPKPENDEEDKWTSTVHPSVAINARSLEAKIAPGLWYMSDYGPGKDRHRDIPETEQRVLADLLRRLLQYKPEDRVSAKEAMEHEWFKF